VKAFAIDPDPPRTWAIVFDTGDEPIGGLTQWAREAGIDSAHLTAIGAFERADIGWFDLEKRDYRVNAVVTQVEVVSLVGDITAGVGARDDPKIHAHVVLARSDGTALGGHLLSATVRPTLEVVVTEASRALRRRHDPATGLALIDLPTRAEPRPPSSDGG
jgi:predicted DNA-binding protein with PD1-like motif